MTKQTLDNLVFQSKEIDKDAMKHFSSTSKEDMLYAIHALTNTIIFLAAYIETKEY